MARDDYIVLDEFPHQNMRSYWHPGCDTRWIVPMDDVTRQPTHECAGCYETLSVYVRVENAHGSFRDTGL